MLTVSRRWDPSWRARPIRSRARRAGDALRRLLRHRSFQTGLVLFAIILAAAVFAPLITAADPNKLAMRCRGSSRCSTYQSAPWTFGRSQLARVVYGFSSR